MGKTDFLRRLAKGAGLAFSTARQLINREHPRTLLGNARLIVIDALDEVAARQDGDAVDLVIQKLGLLGYPRFVLSCRVADWQAATSVAAIGEQYPSHPLQLHLEPLARDDQTAILSASVGDQHVDRAVADDTGDRRARHARSRPPRPCPAVELPAVEMDGASCPRRRSVGVARAALVQSARDSAEARGYRALLRLVRGGELRPVHHERLAPGSLVLWNGAIQ
jgi:hypothetical protein